MYGSNNNIIFLSCKIIVLSPNIRNRKRIGRNNVNREKVSVKGNKS